MERRILKEGSVTCVLEPRGESGLEGYNAGGVYRYQEMEDAKGVYYRVYPEPESKYYETCKPHFFNRFFNPLMSP